MTVTTILFNLVFNLLPHSHFNHPFPSPLLSSSLYPTGSEAEALAVPVDETGQWLPERINLDSHGEIMRIGVQKALLEGHFCDAVSAATNIANSRLSSVSHSNSTSMHDTAPPLSLSIHRFLSTSSPGSTTHSSIHRPHFLSHSNSPSASVHTLSMIREAEEEEGGSKGDVVIPRVALGRRQILSNWTSSSKSGEASSSHGGPVIATMASMNNNTLGHNNNQNTSRLILECGLEIRSYSLSSSTEYTQAELTSRCVTILTAPLPYDPTVDLVAADLKVTPAVVAAIDRVWASPISIERISAASLGACLVQNMQKRLLNNEDTTDLLIGGIEASLWIAEQWAADLRTIFPHLNVETISANKLLGLGSTSASKAFFPGADAVLARRIDKNTCVLMISQSGQTFPTLHATRKLTRLVGNRLWLLTGCFGSKMEQAMVEGYKESHMTYGRDRVFNNYSGNRPAEPSSVAVAATWHTLTRLLMQLVYIVRDACPGGRLLQPWEKQKEEEVAAAAAAAAIITAAVAEALVNSSKRSDSISEKYLRSASISKGESVSVSVETSKPITPAQLPVSPPLPPPAVPVPVATSPMIMLLSDGCIDDMNSLLTYAIPASLAAIVGYDIDGEPLNKPEELTAAQRMWRVLMSFRGREGK